MRNPKTGEQYSVWILNHCDEFVPWDSVEFDSAVLVLGAVSPYKGYKFWFELFEDISGLSLTIWYPMNAKKGEEINVKIQECYIYRTNRYFMDTRQLRTYCIYS